MLCQSGPLRDYSCRLARPWWLAWDLDNHGLDLFDKSLTQMVFYNLYRRCSIERVRSCMENGQKQILCTLVVLEMLHIQTAFLQFTSLNMSAVALEMSVSC